MTFPVLTKPVKKAHKQVKDSNSAIPFDEKKSGSSWYIGHHNFADMLEAAV
jgi:hypothetical protein